MQARTIFKKPSVIGVLFGSILLAVSLTPSLIPREWTAQGLISGLSFVSGYGLGVGLFALWRYLQLPTIAEPYQRRVSQISLVVCAVILMLFAYRALGWQNSVRSMVGLEPVDSAHPVRVVLLAVAISILLIVFFRTLLWIVQAIVRFVAKHIPRRFGTVLGIVLAIGFVVFLVNGLLLQTVADVANASYALTDNSTDPNVNQPTSTLRSGGPESLVEWDTLGKQGRRFSGTGPSAQQIGDFWNGEPAEEPIRVYIGSKSADTLEERAELALKELIRTGAFERDVLTLVTSTGNGWVDSNAIDSLEYMHGGNTATVSFQYSYLPSVFALLADKDSAPEASTAMFDTIHEYWSALDEESRPDFYLYGLSLGAYGSQAVVSDVNLLNDPIDGAMWAGPPFVSEAWRQITHAREPGTPIWRPIYQDGATVRFTNQGEGLTEIEDGWKENRFIFLQQAGDPIVFFTVDSLFREPEWLKAGSRSPKVVDEMRWFPVATFWQLVFDMVLGTSDTLPDGNGHRYSSDSYIDGWHALTQPQDWSDQMTESLKSKFRTMPNPNKP
jgi:uncharacterized membrane protein